MKIIGKKILALLLALTMCMSMLCTNAWAAEATPEEDSSAVELQESEQAEISTEEEGTEDEDASAEEGSATAEEYEAENAEDEQSETNTEEEKTEVEEDDVAAEDAAFENSTAFPNEDAEVEEVQPQTITGFADFDIKQNALYFSKQNKPSLKDLLEKLPTTLDVYLDNSNETASVEVSWFCVGDEYETSKYYYFQFSPQWDEGKYVLADGIELLTDAPYIAVFLTADNNSGISTYSVTGNSNETTIYNFLRNTLGLNVAASCGVLANIQSESSFSPTALNSNDTGGTQSYGICQWNNGAAAGNRYGALITWCNNNGYNYTTLTGQLYFMKYELESSSYYRYSTLKNSIENSAEGAASAALIWATYYEGCSSAYYTTRQNLAKNTYWPEYSGSSTALTLEKSVATLDRTIVAEGDIVTLTWTKVEGATKYILDGWHNDEEIIWKDITALSSCELSFNKNGIYQFYIIAVNNTGSTEIKSTSQKIELFVGEPYYTEKKVIFDMQGGTVAGAHKTYTATGVNVERGTRALIVYTVSGTTPNTNTYGREVAVSRDGYVSAVRAYGSENQLTVPSGGFIVSGHNDYGVGGCEFTNEVSVGDYVGYDYNTKLVSAYHDLDSYLVENKYVDSGSVYGTLPVPTREGYLFDGWYTSASGGTRITQSSTYIQNTLYAHWVMEEDAEPVATTIYNSNYYELFDYSISWTEAQAFCEARGGHLVTITSKEENQTVVALTANGVMGVYYIGCTDEVEEGTWEWVTGEPFGYSNWDPDLPEPNNGTDGNYGNIIAIDNPPNKQIGEWTDQPDKNTENSFYYYGNCGFICEYELTDLKDCTITLSASNYTYDGSAKTPGVTVRDGSKVLIENTDYTVSYTNNVEPGTATVTITGIGNYTGTITETFTISAATQTIASGYSGYTTWALTDDGVLTFSGNGAMKNYTTKTAMPWYDYIDQITSVVMENGITSIGNYAFYGMPNLTSVTIPESVTTIGTYAFKSCTALDGVVLPSTLTTLGDSAFYGCTSLTAIDIPASLYTVKPYTFKNCTALASVTFHEGNLMKLSDSAFYDTALTEVAFPACLDIIDVYCFKNCSSLASITIPSGDLTQIREAVFYGTAISTITIPEGVTSVGSYAFKSCTNLTSVSLPGTLTRIGEAAFYSCTGLTTLVIPDSVTTIGNYAFRNCVGLTSVTFGSGLSTIGESSFYGSGKLTSLVIPEGVTTIGAYAFKSCTGLTSVNLPTSLTTIGDSGFYGCTGLISITIPANVTSLGSYVFSRDTGLKEIEFLGSAPTIGNSAFTKVVATVYYPETDASWTSSVKQNYGGTLTWRAVS